MAFVQGVFVYLVLILLLFARSNSYRLDLDSSDSIGLLQVLQELGVRTEEIDTGLCNFPGISCQKRASSNPASLRVTKIVLPNRSLSGSLSSSIGQLGELRELYLPDNSLSGRIPSQISNCRKLLVVNLHNNKLYGEISEEISSLVHLRSLDLSFNGISGDLSIFKRLKNLENLSIAENSFTGSSNDLRNSLKKLKVFNYTGNPLLQTDDFLPKRYIFAETPNNTTNKTKSVSVSPAPAPAPTPSNTSNKKKKVKKYLIGFFAGLIAGFLSGIIASLLFRVVLNLIRGTTKDSGLSIFSSIIKKEDLAFLEKEEDALSSLEMIGRGGCGEVYRAELAGSSGKVIAIKKINQPAVDAADLEDEETKNLNKRMRQIRSEIQTVGHIRHRNLLPLLAHVSKGETHFLVYEYMKNGSLQDILNQVSTGQRDLSWPARHRIAVGIAAGLEYLHMHHNPRIIHRDLKPANVLLDDDMQARIADFGLARSVPDINTHVTTTNVAGTVGFIAPEYHQTLKFTDKCDIYSFGVLLAVLVVGKLPSDEFFQQTEELNMVTWLKNIMRSENQKRAIDEKLLGNGSEDQMLLVLKIATFCTMDDPKERPNSKDIYTMLTQIKS